MPVRAGRGSRLCCRSRRRFGTEVTPKGPGWYVPDTGVRRLGAPNPSARATDRTPSAAPGVRIELSLFEVRVGARGSVVRAPGGDASSGGGASRCTDARACGSDASRDGSHGSGRTAGPRGGRPARSAARHRQDAHSDGHGAPARPARLRRRNARGRLLPRRTRIRPRPHQHAGRRRVHLDGVGPRRVGGVRAARPTARRDGRATPFPPARRSGLHDHVPSHVREDDFIMSRLLVHARLGTITATHTVERHVEEEVKECPSGVW